MDCMATTFPPPTGPSLASTVILRQAPTGAAAWRPEARARSWSELTPEYTPRLVRTATFAGRVWARILDLFIYGGPVALTVGAAALVVPRDPDGMPADTKVAALVIAVPVIVATIVAFRLFRTMALDGSTIGRQTARIIVVKARTEGPIGYGRAIVRTGSVLAMRALLPISWAIAFRTEQAPEMAFIGFACVVLLNVLDTMWMLWDPRRQTLHDKVAGSMVVRD
jgi:uncharacterized RDD family membrane protein YckC